MKLLNKPLVLICLIATAFITTYSFGSANDLLTKTYTLTYGNEHETSSLIISNGELYINIAHLKSLLGYKTNIEGGNITISDAKETVSNKVENNGDIYSGELLNGNRHGMGTLYIKEGGKYEGQWSNGLYDGLGTLILANGDIYIGSFSKGFIHGEGKMFYPDGSYYDGHYTYGVKNGFGLYYVDSDNKYNGYWENGLRNGQGKAYVNGAYKKGLWENNQLIKSMSDASMSF